MNLEQAIANVTKVLAAHSAPLEEHKIIQHSFGMILQAIKPVKETKEAPPKPELVAAPKAAKAPR